MMRCVGNLLLHAVSVVATHCADAVYDHGGILLVSVDRNGYVWVDSDLDAGIPGEVIGAFPLGEGRLTLSRTLREEFEFAMSTRAFVPPRVRGPGRKSLEGTA